MDDGAGPEDKTGLPELITQEPKVGEQKNPPPIIDFDPPNAPPGKEKKPAGVSPAPFSGGAPSVSVTLIDPRALVPPGSSPVRLPLLGDQTIAAQGIVPPAKGGELNRFNKYVQGLFDPTNTLDLIQGRRPGSSF